MAKSKSLKKSKILSYDSGGDFSFNPLSIALDKNISKDGSSLHINGKTHQNGGTPLDTDNDGVANVEGEKDEKIRNEFIFSNTLGYDKEGNPTFKDKDVKTTFANEVGSVENRFRKRPEYDKIGMDTKEEAMGKIKADNQKVLQVKEIIKNKGKLPKAAGGMHIGTGFDPVPKTLNQWGQNQGNGLSDNNAWGASTLNVPAASRMPEVVPDNFQTSNIDSLNPDLTKYPDATIDNGANKGPTAAQISGYAGAAGNALRSTGITTDYQNQSGTASAFNAIKETSKSVPFVGGFVTAGDAVGDAFQTGANVARKKGNEPGMVAASHFQGFFDPISTVQKISDVAQSGKISKGEAAGLGIAALLGGSAFINPIMEKKFGKELHPDAFRKEQRPSFINSEGVKVSKYGGDLPKAAFGMNAETEYNLAKIGELGLKGASVFQKPESQELYQDTTPIQRQRFIADNTALNTGYNAAVKTLASQSPQARAANMANMYATMTDQQNQYNTQIQNQNIGLNQAYEAAKSGQTRYNIQNKYLTDDINARNRAASRNMQRDFYTDAGNYANNRYEFQAQDRTNRIQFGALNNMYKNYRLTPEYETLLKAGLTDAQIIQYKFGQ